MVGDLPSMGALPHMSRVTQSVYAALLRARIEEQGWGDVVSTQVGRIMGPAVLLTSNGKTYGKESALGSVFRETAPAPSYNAVVQGKIH